MTKALLPEAHDDNHGLHDDLARFLSIKLNRRRMLILGGLMSGSWLLSGCGDGGSDGDSSSSASSTDEANSSDGDSGGSDSGSDTSSCSVIPNETEGPYPADGSNGRNVLTLSGIVRSDIRTSVGTGNTAEGIPLTIKLNLIDTNANCAALAGYAIYLWHCNRNGEYSLYSANVVNEDYLRGVQETDSTGIVQFTSIFPACYSGRWPHIHFEVYPTLGSAGSYASKIHTSQLALPEDVCNLVYATSGYEESVNNLARISLATDNVFSDGYATQMAQVTGNVTDGFTAVLDVGIAI